MKKTMIRTTLVGLCAVGGTAHADEETSVHGSACVSNDAVTITKWGIRNPTDHVAKVFCPIARRDNDYYNRLLGFSFRAYDRHPTMNVECTLRALAFDTVRFAIGGSTVGSSDGYMWVTKDTDQSISHLTSLVVECAIPPVWNGNVSHVVRISTHER